MTTIGLIGSGHIGSTVARLAVDAGHDVVLSNSRGPETLADLVDQLGPHARAATAAEAAAAGDIVVVTIPLKAYRSVPVEPLRSKVVIDTNNYYPQRDGQIPELDDESTTVSELLARRAPGAHVVKAFNHILASELTTDGSPAGTKGLTLFIVPRLRHVGWAVTIGCLLAGIAGNLTDRLFREPGPFHGHVVDFIDYFGLFIGNVADIAIVGAAGLVLLLGVRGTTLDGGTARPSAKGSRG